jgi:hypothetical protein
MNFMRPLLTIFIFKHEWATHGTCYSTLKRGCLPRDSPRGTEAVLFFQRVVELFKKLPTYDWLARSGITPNQTRTHTLAEVIDALKEASGVRCMLFCSTVVLMTELIRSIPQPSSVPAKRSKESVGISVSGAHSSTASSSQLVRGTISHRVKCHA